jgi:serine/threonine protein kinase
MADDLRPASEQPEARPEAAPPAFIPDHELIQIIGKGGCGEVWLARNALGAYRAIKIVYEKTFRHRRPFEREFNGVKKFEPLSRLHDGLTDVLQVGRDEAGGYFYCVMELADDVRSGLTITPKDYSPRTLADDVSQHRRLPVQECLQIGAVIASALGFLHRHGLVHRDVKPSNIVFVNGVPKLADIGLVTELTDAKSFVGTDGFIPPEGPGTIQADIYSLGKVLYEISTGKDRRDFPELPTQCEQTIHERELVELNKIILKACRADPKKRYQSAEEMVEDLQAVQRGETAKTHGKRGWIVKAIGTSVVLLGVCALLVYGLTTKQHHQSGSSASGSRDPIAVIVPSGLVGWWRAEKGALDTASGTSDLLLNGASTLADGEVGRAFRFDGVDDHVRIRDRAALRITGPMTVEMWINRATNGRQQNILSKWSISLEEGEVRSYGLACYQSGRVSFGVSSNGRAEAKTVVSKTALPLNQWAHVAGTYDGTNLNIYIDGLLQSQMAYAEGIFPGNCDIGIGAAVGMSARGQALQPFCGRIDEVSIYNRGLTPKEIFAIYKAGRAGKRPLPSAYQPPPAGLVGWWRGEEDARDAVGIHHGTLMNGTSFAPGKIGQAFRFDGTNGCVKVPRAPDLDVGKDLTIDFWMKPDPDNFMDKCCQALVDTDFYEIGIEPGWTALTGIDMCVVTDIGIPLEQIFRTDSHPSLVCTAETNSQAAVISRNEWHYIAGTYDGSSLQLYIDGKPWGIPTRHSGPIFPMSPTSFLAFGSAAGKNFYPKDLVGNRYYKGLLDEVRIFNRALSAKEIADAFRAVAGMQPGAATPQNP